MTVAPGAELRIGAQPLYRNSVDKHYGISVCSGMDSSVEFEWDDAKAASNLAKHRVSFRYAVAVFLDAARVDVDATRSADGEIRRKVVGVIEDRLYTVVYTLRNTTIRLISARRANRKEEFVYGPVYAGPQ